MNQIVKKLRRLSGEELYCLSEAVDAELHGRDQRQTPRGYRRSTYMVDVVRGKSRAPRYPNDRTRRLAA